MFLWAGKFSPAINKKRVYPRVVACCQFFAKFDKEFVLPIKQQRHADTNVHKSCHGTVGLSSFTTSVQKLLLGYYTKTADQQRNLAAQHPKFYRKSITSSLSLHPFVKTPIISPLFVFFLSPAQYISRFEQRLGNHVSPLDCLTAVVRGRVLLCLTGGWQGGKWGSAVQ